MSETSISESHYIVAASVINEPDFIGQNVIPGNHQTINSQHIVLNKCIFSQKIESNNLKHFAWKFTFNECIFLFGANFTKHTNLEFNTCIFKEDNALSGTKAFLDIKNCKFEGPLIIKGTITTGNLILEDCNFDNELKLEINPQESAYLTRINSNSKIVIHKSHCQKDLELTQITASAIEIDSDISINGHLQLSHIDANEVLFDELTVNNRFMINQINTSALKILNLNTPLLSCFSLNTFGKAEIYTDNIKKLHFQDCSAWDLCLSGLISKDTYFKFSNIECGKLVFDNLENEGSLDLNEVVVLKSWNVILSDLKKTDLIHCNMMEAKWVFKNSKITELFVAGTRFPKRVYNEYEILDDEQARLAYGQLHKAMLNMGDSVNALLYQSSEIAAHFRQLKWTTSSKDSTTKLNLLLNLLSNDFGRSWTRGILFSFGTAVAFFFLLTISTEEYTFGWAMDYDPNLLGSFFRFINPLRFYETEKIYEDAGTLKLTPGSYVIDFLARVIIAYGFYQTIQAFRRLGKS